MRSAVSLMSAVYLSNEEGTSKGMKFRIRKAWGVFAASGVGGWQG